jgi:hypothetical protein
LCAQRLGSGDPSLFTTHDEFLGLHGAQEMTMTLTRSKGHRSTCTPSKSEKLDTRLRHEDEAEEYLVTGRIEAGTQRDFYVCHRKTDSEALIDHTFQIGFGMLG